MKINWIKKVRNALIITVVIVVGWYLWGRANDKAVKSTIDQTSVNVTIIPTQTITPEITKIPEKIFSGNFVDGNPLDKGSGNVKILEQNGNYYVIMADDFQVSDGPDLYVYLTTESGSQIDTSKALNLGKLKSQKGTQSYQITKEQFDKYNKQVIIWCQAFAVVFSRAELKQI